MNFLYVIIISLVFISCQKKKKSDEDEAAAGQGVTSGGGVAGDIADDETNGQGGENGNGNGNGNNSSQENSEPDTTPPPSLTSATGVTGFRIGGIKLTLTFPADVSDYDSIEIYRSTGSGSTGVAAPNCGSGTLATTITGFDLNPTLFFDETPTANEYYSYRICIKDTAANITSTDTVIDAQSKSLTFHRQYEASDIDGDGTPNSGDIGSATDTTWGDLTGTANATANGFPPSTAHNGWDGDGTPSDPYRFKFEGTDDDWDIGAQAASNTYAVWFKGHHFSEDCESSGSDVFSRRDGSGHATGIWICDYGINTQMESGDILGTGLGTDWNFAAIVHDSTDLNLYLNGVYVDKLTANAEDAVSIDAYIGQYHSGPGHFDGEIGSYFSSTSQLTDKEILELYAKDRDKFETSVSGPKITRSTNSFSDTSGGESAKLYGWNFDEIKKLKIGGQDVAFTVDTKSSLSYTTPALANGDHDIVISPLSGSDITYSDMYFANTNIPKDNVLAIWDAARIDSLDLRGNDVDSDSWRSLVNGRVLTVQNVTLPSVDANSGFRGDGTTSDPYRIAINNNNDCAVDAAFPAVRAISVWFRVHSIPGTCSAANQRSIVEKTNYHTNSLNTWMYVCNSNEIRFGYNDGTERTGTVSLNTWHHAVITHDGTDAYYFLDDVQVGAKVTVAADNSIGQLTIGCLDFQKSLDGDIAKVSFYSDHLSLSGPDEVEALHNADIGRFQ